MIGAGGFMRRRLRGVLEKQAHISEQTKDVSHFASNVTASVQQLMQMSVVGLGAILVSTGQAGFGGNYRMYDFIWKSTLTLRATLINFG